MSTTDVNPPDLLLFFFLVQTTPCISTGHGVVAREHGTLLGCQYQTSLCQYRTSHSPRVARRA
eukprot:62864-Rhodomonas_salina.4